MLQSCRWIARNCRFAAGYRKPNNAFELATVVINNSNHLDAYMGVARAINKFTKVFEGMMNGPVKMPNDIAGMAMDLYSMRVDMTTMIRQLGQTRESKMIIKPLRDSTTHMAQLSEGLLTRLHTVNFGTDPLEPGTFDVPGGFEYQAPQPGEPSFWPEHPDDFNPPQAPQGGMQTMPSAPAPKAKRPAPAKRPRAAQVQQDMLSTDVNYLIRSTLAPAIKGVAEACKAALAFKWADQDVMRAKLMKWFEAGKGGMNWYNNIHDLLVSELGQKHAAVFVDFLAATSPRMPVERNVRLAIELYKRYQQSDKNFANFMRTHVPNIEKAWGGNELSGNKVKSFAANLKGDPNAVTLDTWMRQAFAINSESFLSKDNLYEVVANACRELAGELGVEPRQFQAAVWTGIKTQLGPQSLTAKPIDEVLAEEWDMFAKYKKEEPSPQAQPQQQTLFQ